MTPEQQRIAIATLLGWKKVSIHSWDNGVRIALEWTSIEQIPNYYDSLDACHDFEKILLKDTNSLWFPYCRALHIATTGMGEHANAPQRCEAFLKAFDLWIEPSTGGKP